MTINSKRTVTLRTLRLCVRVVGRVSARGKLEQVVHARDEGPHTGDDRDDHRVDQRPHHRLDLLVEFVQKVPLRQGLHRARVGREF